ncbi:MAG: S8 family serine peptidase [Elusimicrobia bacterium]|nr:S8 family serine peptidase [Elusimicrobiota bacterium]
MRLLALLLAASAPVFAAPPRLALDARALEQLRHAAKDEASPAPAAAERECSPANPPDRAHEDPSFIRTAYYCDASGRVSRKLETFTRTGTPSNETLYDDRGRRARYRIWNIDFQQTGERTYEHLDDGSFIQSDLDLATRQVHGREQFLGKVRLRRWHYAKDDERGGAYVLTHDDAYVYAPGSDKERVGARRLYASTGHETEVILFQYDPKDKPDARPVSFVAYDSDGRLIRQYSTERSLAEALDLRSIYRHESDESVRRRQARVDAPDRVAVAMIDSGFDVFSPHVADKMWRRRLSPADEEEWRELVMGWDWERQRPIPLERIDIPRKGEAPMSHGSHTGTIAAGDLDYAAILGFAGDFTNPRYLERISAFLKKHDVRFANMSFAFPTGGIMGDMSAGCNALDFMIHRNPQALFAAAAGNDTANLDEAHEHLCPAMLKQPNLITVGSLDASELDEARLHEYKMSSFSNFGTRDVDVLAPGERIVAADLGGILARHSGTSMASPMLLRLAALPLHREFPELSAPQLKELILKTAYVNLEAPFPVRSGGILFPSRARAAAALFRANPSLGIDAAALAARQSLDLLRPGESRDAAYLDRLKTFWRSRRL